MAKLKSIAKRVAASSLERPENRLVRDLISTIENTQRPYKPSRWYKPSGLGCVKKMYFERIGEPIVQKGGFQLIGMGEVGTHRHEDLQEYFFKMQKVNKELKWINVEEYLKENPVEGTIVDNSFIKNKYETKCKNELLQLSFLSDGLIEYEGTLYILEIKTESMFKFNKQEKQFPDHEIQAACYAMSLGVKDVMFLYEDRDSLDKKMYHFTVTEDIEDYVVERIQYVEDCVRKGTEPKEKCSSSYCQYCKGRGR